MRLELTKKTDLAFQALEVLSRATDQRVAGPALAAELEITTQYLPHVMAPLTRAGWVTSSSGPKGGYVVTTNLDAVSLLDLIEAVEGEFDDSRCLHLGPRHDNDHHCALHDPWMRARTALLDELDTDSLADIIAPSI
ncbi:MAG: Rrf2 family transcriptional regulator [Actinomycetota bacterium]